MFDIDKDRKRPFNFRLWNVKVYDLNDRILVKYQVAAIDRKTAEETMRDEIVHRPSLRSNFGRVEAKLVVKNGLGITVLVRQS